LLREHTLAELYMLPVVKPLAPSRATEAFESGWGRGGSAAGDRYDVDDLDRLRSSPPFLLIEINFEFFLLRGKYD
jgi:hypothetical protein